MNYIEPEDTYLTPKDWNMNGLSIDSVIEGCETFGRKYRFIKTPDEYGHEKMMLLLLFLMAKLGCLRPCNL
ncbi:MAG: hypothetical protein ABJN57_07420 [Hyphomicrobiales bacterium]